MRGGSRLECVGQHVLSAQRQAAKWMLEGSTDTPVLPKSRNWVSGPVRYSSHFTPMSRVARRSPHTRTHSHAPYPPYPSHNLCPIQFSRSGVNSMSWSWNNRITAAALILNRHWPTLLLYVGEREKRIRCPNASNDSDLMALTALFNLKACSCYYFLIMGMQLCWWD